MSFLQHPLRIALLILCTGLVTQALMLMSTRSNVLDLPLVDEATYHRMAHQIAGDKKIPSRPFWQPPLYPLSMSMVYKAAPHTEQLYTRKFQIILTALTALLTWLVARRFTREGLAVSAGLLTCFCGPLLFFNSRLLPAGPAAFMMMWMLWSIINAAERPGIRAWMAAGLILGLSALMIPNVLVIIPLFAAWLVLQARRRLDNKEAQLHAIAAMVGCAVCITWISVENYKRSGEWVPISTNGGINLYIGNNAEADRTIAIRPGTAEWKALAAMPHIDEVKSDSAADYWFRKQVFTYALEHPVDFTANMFKKTLHFLNGHEIPRNLDMYSLRSESSWLSATVWKLGSFGFPFSLILPLALVGIMVRFKERDVSHLPMGFLILYSLSIILFFPAARYRVPILPVAIIFAVIGAHWLWTERGSFKEKTYAIRAGAGIAMLIISCLPLSFPTDSVNFKAELYNAAGAGFEVRQKHNKALRYFEMALKEDPQHADACSNIGLVYMGLGEEDEALGWLAQALVRNDRHSGAYNSMGIIFYKRGILADARENFSMAVAVDPINFRAWNNLGLINAAENKLDDALGAFSRAVQVHPDFMEGYLNIAMMYVHMKEYDKALEFTSYLLARQPGHEAAKALEERVKKEKREAVSRSSELS